jgi:GTPase
VDADMTVISTCAPLATTAPAPAGHVAHALLRRRSAVQKPLEIRVAVIGNVDSGKSTMVGVLTRAMLDDGRGAARAKVFKHDHEGVTGRTSAIGQHNLCLNSTGLILNDTMFKNSTCSEYVSRSSKVITLVDLAGHERYFKTTAYGLTGVHCYLAVVARDKSNPSVQPSHRHCIAQPVMFGQMAR